MRGLRTFGTPEQRERVDRRFEQVRAWLLATKAEDTEDRVFRLGLHLVLHRTGRRGEFDREGDVRAADGDVLDELQRDDVALEVRVLHGPECFEDVRFVEWFLHTCRVGA